jgi:hypothetical protein
MDYRLRGNDAAEQPARAVPGVFPLLHRVTLSIDTGGDFLDRARTRRVWPRKPARLRRVRFARRLGQPFRPMTGGAALRLAAPPAPPARGCSASPACLAHYRTETQQRNPMPLSLKP